MITDRLRRLTTATPTEVLELAAAAGYPALPLTPMQLTVAHGRTAWEAFASAHAGTTLALARRKLQDYMRDH